MSDLGMPPPEKSADSNNGAPPTNEKAPADEKMVEEKPTVNENLAMDEKPGVSDTPTINENPAVSDTPTINENPAVNKTPMINATPPINEKQMVGDKNTAQKDGMAGKDELPRAMITNRGFLPSAVIVFFFGVAVHFTHRLSLRFPNVGPVAAIFLMAFMFEWQRRRGRFTFARIERRPLVDMTQLYQKQPFVRQDDDTVVMATPVEAALVKSSITSALYLKKNPQMDVEEEKEEEKRDQ